MLIGHQKHRDSEKHLHIRGENRMSLTGVNGSVETPPHTWRKFLHKITPRGDRRNTSTYVEKIGCVDSDKVGIRKHLHIRGENDRALFSEANQRKHLHIRGENRFYIGIRRLIMETPPHTWRKSSVYRVPERISGNTSTYVEKIYYQSTA